MNQKMAWTAPDMWGGLCTTCLKREMDGRGM